MTGSTLSRQPPTTPASSWAAGLSPLELILAVSIALGVIVGGWLWTAAQLAALISSGGWLDLPLSRMLPVTFALLHHPGDPGSAFPPQAASQLPGPVLFWALAVLLLLALLLPSGWLLVRRARRSQRRSAAARWATARDLKPLVVRRPQPGRLTLGEGPGGRLLAAEPGHSLLVLGPTQSGKTAGLAIPAILDWPGPVVATSVKADLLKDTIEARRQCGQVWVYDPSASLPNLAPASWTPLAACHTWQGALRTALSQLSHDSPGRAYLQRRMAEGKTRREAMRALKRQLTNVIYRHLTIDAGAASLQQAA